MKQRRELCNIPEPVAVTALPTCRVGLRILPGGLVQEIVFMPPEVQICTDLAIGALFHQQLERYLSDPHYPIRFAVMQRGTLFQNRVWHAISAIPAGMTKTYGELAALLKTSPRALGQACGANPFPLLTPCHRVVARAGLGGFAHECAGWLLDTKRWLLAHEAS